MEEAGKSIIKDTDGNTIHVVEKFINRLTGKEEYYIEDADGKKIIHIVKKNSSRLTMDEIMRKTEEASEPPIILEDINNNVKTIPVIEIYNAEKTQKKASDNKFCNDTQLANYKYENFEKLILELLDKEEKDNFEKLNKNDLKKLHKNSTEACVQYLTNIVEKEYAVNYTAEIKRFFIDYAKKNNLKDQIDELFEKAGIKKKLHHKKMERS